MSIDKSREENFISLFPLRLAFGMFSQYTDVPGHCPGRKLRFPPTFVAFAFAYFRYICLWIHGRFFAGRGVFSLKTTFSRGAEDPLAARKQ